MEVGVWVVRASERPSAGRRFAIAKLMRVSGVCKRVARAFSCSEQVARFLTTAAAAAVRSLARHRLK